MLKKKSLLVLHSLIRLILAFIFLFFIIGCGAKLYAAIVGSKASGSFDNLVELIETIEYDEPLPHNLYLDDGNAIIGFTKDSDKIDYDNERWKSYFGRPDTDDCKKDTACLCLCKGELKSTTKSGKDIEPLECKGKLICNSIDNIDFQSEIKSEEMGEGIEGLLPEFTFHNGFYIGRRTINRYIPRISYSPQVIYIKKDKDTNIVHISTKQFEYSP